MPLVLLTSDGRSTRPSLKRVLSQPRWDSIDLTLIDQHLATGSLRNQDIYALDEFLAFREYVEAEGLGDDPDNVLHAITNFGATPTAMRKLSRARKALLLLFEATTLADEIGSAMTKIRKKTRKSLDHPSPGKNLVKSIPERDLPPLWRTALNDMRDSIPGSGEVSAPAPEYVKSLARTVRQFAKCSQDATLLLNLTLDGVIIFEQALMRRDPPLSPRTVRLYLQQIHVFGVYIGADQHFVAHMADRVRLHTRRAYGSSTTIDVRAMKVPDFKAILQMAFDLLDEADKTLDLNSAHALRNRAAAIALVSPFPLRIADLSLLFGVNLTWNGENYHLFVPETSKNKSPYSANIHPVFGMFIDRLVLAGRPSSQLDQARQDCLHEQRALFVDRWSKPSGRTYVSGCWHNMFGTGSHVARVKFHDQFAQLGARGVEMALAACGQRSPKSAEFYRSKAFRQLASSYVLETLITGISEDEWWEFF